MKTNSQYPVIVVENIDESIKMYEDLFGYKVKHTAMTKNNSKVVVIGNDEYEIDLVEKTGDLKAGLQGLRMNVKDIEEAVNNINKAGLLILFGPIKTNNGINVMFKDKNGVIITLVEHQ